MFRRHDWQVRQGFDESFSIATDFDFLCWLCTRGGVAFVPETHFLRSEHNANLTFRETPRLTDVIRILTRYMHRDEMAMRDDYRIALASKVLRLAQFFALCDCKPQSLRMLRAYFQIRRKRLDAFWRPFRHAQLAFIKPLRRPLSFAHLRTVDHEEATASVEIVESLLAEYGLLDPKAMQWREAQRNLESSHRSRSSRAA